MGKHSKNMCQRYQMAVEIISRRWTGLILYSLMQKPMRFNELAEQLEVISDRMLSERLKDLEADGIVERIVDTTPPIRVEYRLTDKGHALNKVVEAIGQWGEQWCVVATQPAEAH